MGHGKGLLHLVPEPRHHHQPVLCRRVVHLQLIMASRIESASEAKGSDVVLAMNCHATSTLCKGIWLTEPQMGEAHESVVRFG